MAPPLWLFFPDYRHSDPYQSLFAAALAPFAEARAGSVTDALEAAGERDVVFHVHWEDAVLAGAAAEAEAGERVGAFLTELSVLRACGGRVIWTRHNAHPHEDRYPIASAALRRGLAGQADVLHAHNAAGAALMRQDGGDPDRIILLRNPDIAPGYPDDITDAAARRYFHLRPEETVFAFLGAVRAYKGLDLLLAAFAAVHRADPAAQLIIGGRQAHSREGRYVLSGPGIRLIPHFVDDGVVQYVLRAADFVVAPYQRTLTSGAVALGLGFGRPVIVPDLPPILETVEPGREALVYRAGDGTDLARVMRQACTIDTATRRRMGEQARWTARAVTFDHLAAALLARLGRVAASAGLPEQHVCERVAEAEPLPVGDPLLAAPIA